MTRVVVVVAFSLLFAGCLKPGAVVCNDGTTCPENTVCEEIGGYCLTDAQATVCNGIDDGTPCDAAGTPGICVREFCEPGCGDGVTDPTEQCDDANFASHDGCSSRCLVEIPTWIPEVPKWRGRTGHSATYHAALGRIVMVGGQTVDGASDEIWHYNPARRAELDGGWVNVTAAFGAADRPSARHSASIAYDSARNVIVLFGGLMAGDPTNETWEYAASARTFNGEPVGVWTKKTFAGPGPSPRYVAAMAYDAVLQKSVLYGGLQNGDLDTWLYDGSWTSVAHAVDPQAFLRASMAFDVTRGKTVLFGASGTTPASTATWEFTGALWTQINTAPNPGNRVWSAMTYDPTRSKLVLYGGTLGTSLGPVASDTWTYDGTWQLVASAANPPGRRAAALVSDPVTQRLVLVGGTAVDAEGPLDDLWELTASGWQLKPPRFEPPLTTASRGAYSIDDGALVVVGGSTTPPAASFEAWKHDGRSWQRIADAPVDRFSHGFVYDARGRRFVMSGGICGNVHPDDCSAIQPKDMVPSTTYALDATSLQWSKLPAIWPGGFERSDMVMVYDETRQRTVVFGGWSRDLDNPDNLGVRRFTDTWVTDGTAWTALDSAERPASCPQAEPSCLPTPLAGWDPVRKVVVLFDPNGVTWELRDDQWVRLIDATPAGPSARSLAAMVYDPGRKRFVMIGGTDYDGMRASDIWELDTMALTWSPVFVAGVSPLPRGQFVLGAHANARALILYGGSGRQGNSRNDTWQLKYLSSTLDEDCTDNMDTDGDAQDDGKDPDCTSPPPPAR